MIPLLQVLFPVLFLAGNLRLGRRDEALKMRFKRSDLRCENSELRCENAAHVECLAKNTKVFDDFDEKGAARVECLAENTRNFDVLHEKEAARVECLVPYMA